jgi:hypothetical protein
MTDGVVAPSLTWQAVAGANHYSVCRDGQIIGTATGTSYTDTAAAPGSHYYTVVAVDAAGNFSSIAEGNSVNVVANTPPTIKAAISPAPNAAGWNNTNATVTFTCSSPAGIRSCTSPITLTSQGNNLHATGTAVNNAGLTSTTTVTVKIDKTAPTATAPTMAKKLFLSAGSSAISASATDALSGATGGEYYIDTDPGAGNGSPMTYASGKINGTVSTTGLSNGSHRVYMRSRDAAGNWSAPVSTTFTVVILF